MAIVSVSQECPVHIAHGAQTPVNCFGEATGLVAALILETAVIDDIPTLLRKWTENDGNASFELEFTDDMTGKNMVVAYTV